MNHKLAACKGEKKNGSEQRRGQILLAARASFSEFGFHNGSLADISRRSGMSVGHIYHYFQSKEEIVEAIAEVALQETLEVHSAILGQPDLLEAFVSHAIEMMLGFSRNEKSRLRLEVTSEAARNPRIARIVQHFDGAVRRSVIEILERIDESRGARLSKMDMELQFELLNVLSAGFLVRSVFANRAEDGELRVALRRAIKGILGEVIHSSSQGFEA